MHNAEHAPYNEAGAEHVPSRKYSDRAVCAESVTQAPTAADMASFRSLPNKWQ